MVSYDPKVASFAKLLELSTAPAIEGLTAGRLVDGFVQFLKDRERHQKLLEKKRVEIARLAEINIQAILEAM